MMLKNAETYFIQLLFCKNRDLLKKKYRRIYDVLFSRYLKIYKLGREAKVDLELINARFLSELGLKGKVVHY